MKKILYIIALCTSTLCLAVDPSLPVIHIPTTNLFGELPSMFNGEEIDTNDWRQAIVEWDALDRTPPEYVEQVTTNSIPIPGAIYTAGEMYKSIITNLMSDVTAYTNSTLTAETVAITLAINTNISESAAYRMEKLYEIIVGFNESVGLPLNAYSFPFEQTNIINTVTNIVQVEK